ncbi:TetR/AcrR family transcriptional regulator [Desulfovibrio sulfodismutans]|uniref:TetR/AcrR family transcriptional regulator n=2 Tax=Desulfovibrionaceae TaxID=194924 RepID=A0A7K3NH94_9BACT|nr:TetR/AcrR family transcriptional regulator [Desulfolutivibrio sulfodismutans]QLA11475.1 TetR family transcriptional regulator [Desulfolutivibrio sulfodismutans DSM 3696]
MAVRMESPLRREQIAEVTLRLVVEEGLGAVTVRRVAQAVGISAAALYRHYKNKSDILAAVLEEHHEIMVDIIRRSRAEAATALDALRRVNMRSMALVEKYCALPVIFLSDALWLGDLRLRDLKLRHHRMFREAILDLISSGQDSGEVRADIRPDEIFVFFLGLVAMPALMRARRPEEVDLPLQTSANWDLFARAVAC